MFDRVGEVVSVVLGALALGYLIYEIDRRQRKLRDLFYVLDSEDADISETILDILTREGIDIRLNSNCIAASKAGNNIAVRATCEGPDAEVQGSHLLLAVGRRPNTDDLGLENTGIARDVRGNVQVDDELRTTVDGVWALGECNGRGAFTHTSYNDYEIVAANLLDGEHRRVSDRITAYALYIDPPLGRAGMTTPARLHITALTRAAASAMAK